MTNKAGGHDSFYVRQADKLDCSIACVAMLLRMTKQNEAATLYDARQVVPDWTAAAGLAPPLLGPALEAKFGPLVVGGPVLEGKFDARVVGLGSEPDLNGAALVLFMSSWVDGSHAVIRNVGHYVVVRRSKRVSTTVLVDEDSESNAEKQPDTAVMVVKVYCPATDGPYWTPWAALVGQGIHHVWRVPI
jgi:hypothetical protein